MFKERAFSFKGAFFMDCNRIATSNLSILSADESTKNHRLRKWVVRVRTVAGDVLSISAIVWLSNPAILRSLARSVRLRSERVMAT